MSNHAKGGLIIFSGFNQRAVIALCRTLELCNFRYVIFAHSKEDSIFKSKYKDKVIAVRRCKYLDIDDFSVCISKIGIKKNEKWLIAPTSEALNYFLLEHKQNIRKLGCDLALVNKELYHKISNKISFIELCNNFGIPVPPSVPLKKEVKTPVVAKPYVTVNDSGKTLYPIIIKNEAQLEVFLRDKDRTNYFFQKYVYGPSYYLQYYVYENGYIDRFSMRNLVQQPDGKSIVAAEVAFIENEKRFEIFEKMLRTIGYRGLIMFEIMFEDSKMDNFFAIEANPRMWGPSQLMVDAGRNLFVSFLNDYYKLNLKMDISKKSNLSDIYFWGSGFLCPQFQCKGMKWHISKKEFWSKYRFFVQNEIYDREDTKDIFISECKGC